MICYYDHDNMTYYNEHAYYDYIIIYVYYARNHFPRNTRPQGLGGPGASFWIGKAVISSKGRVR